jgi:HSP20 family protein
MMCAVITPPRDTQELTEDARQLLAELDREVPGAAQTNTDCRPPVDVIETSSGLEVVVDVPGVPADSLRVAIRRNTLLIVGAKLTTIPDAARYHLAERSYGRFARVVRLDGAFDAARTRARAAAGQLRITLPRLDDRRGRILRIPVEPA